MKRSIKVGAVIVVALGIWALVAPTLARYLIVEKPLAQADAIIVLSGSAVYKERTREAAQLYNQNVAPVVMITNDGGHAGWSSVEQTNVPFVELEQRELIANGVPAEAIAVLPGIVAGTDDEARAVAGAIGARGLRSLLIVTSAYHTRRALRTFDKLLADKNIELGIVAAPLGEQSPEPNRWWLTARGWPMVAGEYVKSAVYYAYY